MNKACVIETFSGLRAWGRHGACTQVGIMSTARQVCNQHVVVARPGERLLDVAKRMRDEHMGCVVVVDTERR